MAISSDTLDNIAALIAMCAADKDVTPISLGYANSGARVGQILTGLNQPTFGPAAHRSRDLENLRQLMSSGEVYDRIRRGATAREVVAIAAARLPKWAANAAR